MSGGIYFNLIKYDNILQTLREFNKNLRDKNSNDFFLYHKEISDAFKTVYEIMGTFMKNLKKF